jgi:hypothetical protein
MRGDSQAKGSGSFRCPLHFQREIFNRIVSPLPPCLSLSELGKMPIFQHYS